MRQTQIANASDVLGDHDMTEYLASSTVAAQYVYWQHDDQRLRSFLLSSNRGMNIWFDEQWDLAEDEANATFNPEFHGADLQADLFASAVGIWPADYFWQLTSAVVKDACTLYEVFLEQTANSVLRRNGASLVNMSTEDSWRWAECELFFRHYLDIEVKPPEVEIILWIRNKLTHLRDEFRTEAGLDELHLKLSDLHIDGPETPEELALSLGEHARYAPKGVHLSQLQTIRILDLMHKQIKAVALEAFQFDYRLKSNAYIAALRTKSPLAIKEFKTAKIINF